MLFRRPQPVPMVDIPANQTVRCRILSAEMKVTKYYRQEYIHFTAEILEGFDKSCKVNGGIYNKAFMRRQGWGTTPEAILGKIFLGKVFQPEGARFAIVEVLSSETC